MIVHMWKGIKDFVVEVGGWLTEFVVIYRAAMIIKEIFNKIFPHIKQLFSKPAPPTPIEVDLALPIEFRSTVEVDAAVEVDFGTVGFGPLSGSCSVQATS